MGNFWSSHLFPPYFLPKLGRFHFGLLWFILVYLLHFGPLEWFLSVYFGQFGQFWSILVYYLIWMIVNGGKQIIIHVRLSIVGHVRVTDSQQGQCIGYSPNSKVYTSKRKKKWKKVHFQVDRPCSLEETLLDNGDDDTSSFSDYLDNDNGDEETLYCIGPNRIEWTNVDWKGLRETK